MCCGVGKPATQRHCSHTLYSRFCGARKLCNASPCMWNASTSTRSWPAVCCIALRFRSRAIAAMSSPCAATSAPTTLCDEGVSRRAQRRTKCKPRAAGPHQLLCGEPPRRSVPLGQRPAETYAHRVFVRHGLVSQLRPLRLFRRRAHNRVDAPEAIVRVVCQPQRAVIATKRVALRPRRPARGGETCGEGAGKPPQPPRPRQPGAPL